MLDEMRSRVLDPRTGDVMESEAIRRTVLNVLYRGGELKTVRVFTRRKSGGPRAGRPAQP